MENGKDLYFVAAKVFLEDGKGNFLATKDKFGDWDIPGGRLRDVDFETPIEAVIQRKIKEELGDSVEYILGKPVTFMRHERNEVLSSGERSKRKIFAIGYQATYKSGDIKLGKNHERYEWLPVKTVEPKDYFTGGWLKGVEEYLVKVRNLN
jgi:hypothetical protein